MTAFSMSVSGKQSGSLHVRRSPEGSCVFLLPTAHQSPEKAKLLADSVEESGSEQQGQHFSLG